MDPLNVLKKLKNIEADREFTAASRSLILNTPQKTRLTFPGFIFKTLEVGASLALAGLLIFMIIGGFSAWKFFAPLQIASLNSSALKAEAEAIDIQIQLADLNYGGSALGAASGESTQASAASPASGGKEAKGINDAQNQKTGNISSTISVDEALEKLSE